MKQKEPKFEITCDGSAVTEIKVNGNPIYCGIKRIKYCADADVNDGVPVLEISFIGFELAINTNTHPTIDDNTIETLCFFEGDRVRKCLDRIEKDLNTQHTGQ